MSHSSPSDQGPRRHGSAGHTETVVAEAIRLGALGAVVGSVAALPGAYEGARSGATSPETAVRTVIRAGSRAALATGAGAVAASLAGNNGLLRLTAMLVAGGLTLHAIGPEQPGAAGKSADTADTVA